MQLRPDGFPRRNDVTLNTPAELAIRAATEAVEAAGAHPLLTDAVVLLVQARNKVADFVDEEMRRVSGSRSASVSSG